MQSEYLLVNFKDSRSVKVNDTPVGVTNHVMTLEPGDYVITLDGDGFTPPTQNIELVGTSHGHPKVVVFT